jgi:hypothetical protein
LNTLNFIGVTRFKNILGAQGAILFMTKKKGFMERIFGKKDSSCCCCGPKIVPKEGSCCSSEEKKEEKE